MEASMGLDLGAPAAGPVLCSCQPEAPQTRHEGTMAEGTLQSRLREKEFTEGFV